MALRSCLLVALLILVFGCGRTPNQPTATTPNVAAPSAVATSDFELAGPRKDPDGNDLEFSTTDYDQRQILLAARIISKEPELGEAYSRYFPAKREVKFHGAKLLYFEDEFMEEWVGCCIDAGFGIVLEGKPDAALAELASRRDCRVLGFADANWPTDVEAALRKSVANVDSVYKFSCHENDSLMLAQARSRDLHVQQVNAFFSAVQANDEAGVTRLLPVWSDMSRLRQYFHRELKLKAVREGLDQRSLVLDFECRPGDEECPEHAYFAFDAYEKLSGMEVFLHSEVGQSEWGERDKDLHELPDLVSRIRLPTPG